MWYYLLENYSIIWSLFYRLQVSLWPQWHLQNHNKTAMNLINKKTTRTSRPQYTIPSSLKMLGFAPITFRPFPPVRGFRESTWGKTRTRRWGFWDRRGYPNCLHIKLKFDTRSQSMTIWSPKNIPSWLSSLIREDGFQEQLKYIPITVLTCSAHSPWTLHIQDHTYLIHELLNTTLIDWTDNPSTWNCHLPNLECKRTNFCTFVKFIP